MTSGVLHADGSVTDIQDRPHTQPGVVEVAAHPSATATRYVLDTSVSPPRVVADPRIAAEAAYEAQVQAQMRAQAVAALAAQGIMAPT